MILENWSQVSGRHKDSCIYLSQVPILCNNIEIGKYCMRVSTHVMLYKYQYQIQTQYRYIPIFGASMHHSLEPRRYTR